MNKHVATGPAWQVRQAAQQGLLEKIKQQIRGDSWEEAYKKSPSLDIYGTWFYLLHGALRYRKHKIGYSDLSRNGWAYNRWAANLLSEISKEIKEFERSQEEGDIIFAKLLEWLAGEIAQPYVGAYQDQEKKMLQTLYGIERVSDEVPYE